MDCLCLDAIQPLKNTSQDFSKSIFIARKEWRAGSKGYIPARSGSECGCCVLISPSNKEKENRKLTNCTSCFFPTVPPGFFRLSKKKYEAYSLVKKKKNFIMTPPDLYQLYLFILWGWFEEKHKAAKIHWQDSWTWCKTLVFCVECRTTLV